MIGPKILPKWLKGAYLKAVNHRCEDCLIKEGERRKDGTIVKLEVHRIIQGYNEGTYRPGNVKICCDRCHKLYGEKW